MSRRLLVLVAALCACRSSLTERERELALAAPQGRDMCLVRAAAEAVPPASSVAGISAGTRWDSRGPENLAGVTYALLFDPEHPNVYLAGASEALWRSDDGGANWRAVPDLDGLQVMALARDPRNHDVVYAATGFEGAGADGIYKSIDRGATWRKLPESPSSPTIRSIAISPGDSAVLLAGTSSGVFRSTDAGEHWTQTSAAGVNTTVAFEPGDGSKAVAGFRDAGTLGGRAHIALSNDGGATWEAGGGGITANATYSVFVTWAGTGVYATTSDGLRPTIWRSVDGGRTFLSMPSNTFLSGYHIRNVVLAAGDYVIFAGIEAAYSLAGAPFQALPTTRAATSVTWPHTDFLGMFAGPGFDGTANRRLFACTDGGIFVTDDFTTGTWSPLGRGAASTQYYSIDVAENGTIAGGMQDNATSIAADGATDVDHRRDADTTDVVLDRTNPNLCFGGEFGRIVRCNTANILADVGFATRFGDPMVIPPSDPTRMYAAAVSVVRIDNLQSPVPKATYIRAGDPNIHIGAIAVDPASADVVWIAADDGTIDRTRNATAAVPQWTTVFASTSELSAATLSTISIDRHDPRTVLAGGDRGIIESNDDGATWHATSFPAIPVRRIVEHPSRHGWLYAATPVGLFLSGDGGAQWSRAPGPAAPARLDLRDLVFRPKTSILYLATFGRGIWSVEIAGEVLPRRRGVSH